MVEENFKIGVEIEVLQSSLEDVSKQVRRKIKEAFEKGAQEGLKGTSLAGGAAALKSAKGSVGVSAADFAKEIERALAPQISSYEKATKEVVAVMSQLAKKLESTAGKPAAPSAAGKAAASTAGVTKAEEKLTKAIEKEAAAREEAASAARTAAKADTQRAAASRVSGAGGPPQPPQRPPSPVEKGAATVAMQAKASLDELKQAIKAIAPQATRDPEFFKRVGLEVETFVGEGAAAVVKQADKQAKHLEHVLVVAGKSVEKFSNVVTEKVNEILRTGAGQERLQAMGRLSRRDEGRFEVDVRRMSRELFESLAPVSESQPLRGFQKGGEARLTFKLSAEQSERLSKIEDEAQLISEVNRELSTFNGRLGELRKQLLAQGMDVIMSPGLGEKPASELNVIRAETGTGKPGPIESLEMKVMTRNLAAMGLGGAGAIRPVRTFQPHQLARIEGGGMPSVMGEGERQAYERGLYKPGAFKEVTTALLDPGMFPEVFEDQWIFDPKLFQAPIREVKSMVVRNIAEGIQEGSELAAGQVVGTRGEGAETMPVKFDLVGAEAKVKSLEKVVIGGIEGVKIIYEELNDTVSGIKITERAGLKGMGRGVEDWSEKYGLGGGVALGVSTRALGARGAIRPVIEMVANNISDVTGQGAQEIADAIVKAMQEGGMELYAALSKVSKQFGLESIPGVREITEGPLAEAAGGKARVLTGRLAVGRLPLEGMKGEMPIEERYLSAPDIQGLKLRTDTAKMAEDMQARMSKISEGFFELRRGLETLTGQAEVAEEGLRKVLPEEFKRLPADAAKTTAELSGTILDPKYLSALAVSLPTAEGGERLLRMPSVGKGLGQRDYFQTEVGGIEAGSVAHLFDQIIEQAAKARAAMGMIPLTEESDAFQEAAEIASKSLRNQIAEIRRLGFETEEGAAAAQEFVAKFKPVIAALGSGPAGIGYTVGGKERQVQRSAEQYLEFLDEKMTKPRGLEQQVYAIGDLLAERAAGAGKVPGLGAVHKDASVLNKTMELLGITLGANSEAAQKALERLSKLESKLLGLLTEQAFQRGKPTDELKRSIASAREGGVARGPIGTVLGFPTDASKELERAQRIFEGIAASGVEAAEESLQAISRMKALGEMQGGISRDVVLINKKDWENLVQETMKTRGIGREEAEQRLERPGLTMRWPITGPRSFVPARLQPVGDEMVPPGKFGVGAPAPVSSAEDLQLILGTLNEAIQVTIDRIHELGGVGPEAARLGGELRELIDVSQALVPIFKHTGQNMDIDGDKMVFLADTVDTAGSGLKTFTEELAKGAISFRSIFTSIIGKQVSKGGMGGVEEFSEYFGKVVKGRPESLRKAVLRPEDEEMAAFESFAHVAGKKSVGLLTDMFNRMLLSVTAGSKDVGDAMETAIGAIMLGINESLAQKHGTGGVSGPGQFLSAFRMGKMGDIKQGLEGGEGFLGKLGEINKQIKAELETRLYALGAGLEEGGAEALRKFASAQGLDVAKILPAEITGENFTSVIEKIVQELDLYKMITRMFTMMKENAVKAMQAQGLGEEDIQAALADIGKRGIDQRMIIESFFPGYGATRKKAQEDLKGMEPTKKALEALALLPERIATEVESQIAGGGLEAEIDPKVAAATIVQQLTAWWESVRESVQVLSAREISAGYPEGTRVRGRFTKGTSTEKGEEGTIAVSAELYTSFSEARQALMQLAEGAGEVEPQRLLEIGKALQAFMGVIGHEGIHKAAAGLTSVIKRLESSLESSRGVLGRHREQIEGALGGRAGVAKIREKIQDLETLRGAGATEGLGVARKQVEGKWQTMESTMGISDAISTWWRELNRVLVEELLAYRFQGKIDPGYLENSPLSQLPQEVLDFLDSKIDMLSKARPQILETTAKAAGAVTTAVLDGLSEAMNNMGAQAARGAAAGRADYLMSRDFPGAPQVASSRALLGAHERVIEEGRSAFKLRGIERREGRLSYGQPQDKLPFEERLGPLAQEISEIQSSIAAALPDPDTLRNFSRRIRKAALGVRSKLAQLTKTGEVSGTDPQEEYMRVMREFRAAVATQMANAARALEDQIAQAVSTGDTGTAEFRDLVQKFQNAVLQIHDWAASTLNIEGRGKGTVATYFATGKGELLESAKGAGIMPTADTFAAVFQNVAGEGDEAANFLSRMQGPIEQVVENLQKGVDPLQAWSKLFAGLMEYPAEMTADLMKVVEILSKFSRLLGFSEGQFSELTTGLGIVVDRAKRMRDELKKGRVVEKPEDVLGMAASGTKQTRQALAQGLGGTLAESIAAQYDNAERVVEARRKRLEEVIQLPSYKALGAAGRHFEPIAMDIIDPTTGEVVQKLTASFERFGNTVKTQMTQAGAATKGFGQQMTSALRRVVQWGMASGIVYGLVRAFRSLVTTVTDVQTKIAELQKVMDTSITNFEAMQEGAVSMAKNFGISINEVLDGMVVYGQQGLAVNEIMERTNSTLLAVNTTTLTAAKATEALTSVMKVFSAELSSSENAVDAWAAVAAKHAITAEDLALAVQRTGAAAAIAGISFNDFLGIVTAIGSVTRQSGKEVATGIKFMLQSMRKPSSQKQLMNLGIASQDVAGDLRPTMDVLQELASRWDTLTRKQQVNAAQTLAGVRHYNQFLVLMNNWQEVLDASTNAQNSQGFAARKNAIAMQTFAKQMQSLRETVKGFALDLGKSFVGPTTMVVSGLQKVLSILEYIPDSVKATAVAFGGLGVAFQKVAHLAVNTLDFMSGGDLGKKFKEQGMFRSMGQVMKSSVGVFGGMREAVTMPTDLAKDSTQMVAFAESAGLASRGVLGLRTALASLAKMSRVTLLSFGALGVVLGGLAAIWATLPKRGDDMSKELEDQIGKAMAAADSYSNLSRQVGKLEHMYAKAMSAMERASTEGGVSEGLRNLDFQGPATAMHDYQAAVTEASNTMGVFDSGAITGVDEYGNLVMGIGESFKYAAAGAGDFKKAQAAALQIKVIQAYAAEISESMTVWDKTKSIIAGAADVVSEFFGMGTAGSDFFDTNLADYYQTATQELNTLLEQRKKLSEAGRSTVDVEAQIGSVLERQSELREEVLQKSLALKKVLEEMPVFGDLDMAMSTMGPKMAEALQGAIGAGAFGQGATTGSVLMKQLAKSAGMGGMMDYSTMASPARTMEAFLEKGITPQVSKNMFDFVRATGDVVQVSKQAAGALLQMSGGVATGPVAMEEALNTAMNGIAKVDEATGERVVIFYNNLTRKYVELNEGMWGTLQGSLEEQGQMTGVYAKRAAEEAMEGTRKILSLQFTGAMAGIRKPGDVDIGPARFLEVGARERMMDLLPDQVQRMMEIQNEIGNYTKSINEDMSAEGLEDTSKQIDSLSESLLNMIVQLQQEGFQLSVVAHYTQALQDLQLVMEQSIDTSRKAAAQERARMEVQRHMSGDLSGRAVLKDLEFGPTSRELTSMQRLQKRLGSPFETMVSEMSIAQEQLNQGVQSRQDIATREVDFKAMIQELRDRGEKLTKEQMDRLQQQFQKGLSPEQSEFVNAIWDSSSEIQKIQDGQLDVQTRILDVVTAMGQAMSETDPEARATKLKEFFQQQTGEMTLGPLRQLTEKLASSGVIGGDYLDQLRRQMLGVADVGESTFSQRLMTSPGLAVSGRGATRYEKGAGTLAGVISELPAEVQSSIQESIDRIINFENEISMLGKAMSRGGVRGSIDKVMNAGAMERAKTQMETEWEKLLGIDEIRSAFEQNLRGNLATIIPSTSKLGAVIDSGGADLQEMVSSLEKTGLQSFADAGKGVAIAIQDGQRALSQMTENLRIAKSIEDFAMGVENLINEFKKAEALAYEKIGSDLEGAFARVGQAGFRTQFENQRMELEQQYQGPISLQQMRERDKARKQIDFDEREAKIKEKQDIEVAALRQQQGQAEQMRSLIADQLFSGALEGSPETQAMAKSFMDTLTEQLATSEQADMRGGELFFKGVPALEDAARFAQQLKQEAEQKAKENRVGEIKEGMTGVEDKLVQQIQILQQISQGISGQADQTKGLEKTMSSEGSVAGAVAAIPAAAMRAATGGGMQSFTPSGKLDRTGPLAFSNMDLPIFDDPAARQVGPSNFNRVKENEVARTMGNANATVGALVTDPKRGPETTNAEKLEREQTSGTAANTQVEALQALSEQVIALQGVMEQIAKGGLQLPDDFTDAIEELGGTFEEALGNTLTVSVENTPLAVEIPDLESALSSAFSSSGLGSVGAEVADTRLRLEVLESLVDPDGPSVEDRITSATDSLRTNLDEAANALLDLEGKVIELEDKVEPLEGLEDLGLQVTGIQTSVDELSSTVDSNTSSIESVQAEISQILASAEELQSSVTSFGERLDEAEGAVEEGRLAIEEFSSVLDEIRSQAETASSSAEASVEAVDELRSSLLTLQAALESQKQNLELQIRQSVDSTTKLSTRVDSIQSSINQIRSKGENALSIAQQALNQSRIR